MAIWVKRPLHEEEVIGVHRCDDLFESFGVCTELTLSMLKLLSNWPVVSSSPFGMKRLSLERSSERVETLQP